MSTVSIAAFALLTLPWSAHSAFTTTSGSVMTGSPSAFEEAQSRFEQPPQPAFQMRFGEMDRNGDGVITRDEWRGVADGFRENDWNGDGVLSGDEVRPGAVRRQGNGRARGNGQGNQGNNGNNGRDFDLTVANEVSDWTAAGFTGLDRNRDGVITRNEWRDDAQTFQRVDLNRNGVITRAEFTAGAPAAADDRQARFDYLDVNDNGRIERSEWRDSETTFNALDRNRDNVISRAEGLGRAPGQSDFFNSLDVNRNREISRDEWRGSRRSFDQRDLNRDGVLSRRELLDTGTGAVTSGQPVPTSGRSVRVDSTQRWTDTGIFVRAGDTVSFEAQGTVQMSDDRNDTASPAGSRTGRLAADALFPRESAGAMLAQIGNSGAIFVGGRRSIRAATSGQLFLGVNDDHLPDNSGEFRVIVTVQGQ